jgi:hypothetical protein
MAKRDERGRRPARRHLSAVRKELGPRISGVAEVRLLFVFDPAREAVVLVAGDKAGRWSAWYAQSMPLAEERYATYRREAENR